MTNQEKMSKQNATDGGATSDLGMKMRNRKVKEDD